MWKASEDEKTEEAAIMKILCRCTFIAAIAIVGLTGVVRAQQAPKLENEGFNVTLYVLAEGKGGDVQEKIMPIVRRIRTEFGDADLNVASVRTQLLGVGGRVQSRTILDTLGKLEKTDRPIFSEWSLGPIKLDDAVGRTIEFGMFEYFARLTSKIGNEVTYENIKFNLSRVVVPLNAPTLIGNQPLPAGGGSLYFVVVVERAGQSPM